MHSCCRLHERIPSAELSNGQCVQTSAIHPGLMACSRNRYVVTRGCAKCQSPTLGASRASIDDGHNSAILRSTHTLASKIYFETFFATVECHSFVSNTLAPFVINNNIYRLSESTIFLLLLSFCSFHLICSHISL